MDEALGPPPEMAAKADELTPMLSQYLELCERYDDALVLFQVGDFYETFCDAAEATARVLEITLTQREDSTGTYPMAGIPVDNAGSYIQRLLDSGYRVAVADQVEDPEATSGLVERAVTRIVTPGTLTERELLGGADNNFVACLADGYGLALLDVSTGDFFAARLDRLEAVEDELERFDPAEAVVGPDAPTAPFADGCMVTPYEHAAFELETARETVEAYFGSAAAGDDAVVRACGALLSYAEYTRGGSTEAAGRDEGVQSADASGGEATEDAGGSSPAGATAGDGRRLEYINHLTRYDPRDYALLDAVALRSLEVFEPRHVHGLEGAALVETLDETASPLGSRELRDWLRRPLLDEDRIDDRLDGVEALLERVGDRERALDLLGEVYDLERLVAQVSRERADARDLRALASTLSVVPDLRACVENAASDSDLLADIRDRLDDCADLRELVDRAIAESPPIEITEGGVIAEGYDESLDDLRRTEREGKAWIDDLEATERERTGIDSLEVGHNSVHGYYIEVTNPNLDAVPDDYRRRQTLKNSERFYTPELKEREDEIIRAEDRAADREYELFRSVRADVAAETERVQATAGAVAELDALCALATVAAQYDYCRPAVGADGVRIEGGRHPVVERTEDAFVPNPTDLPGERPMAVVTGPNMSGKSTYLRQVALACVMAQVGSFVPARCAELPVVDRVFTRVGASDDIAGGRSTFMVEMTELAAILEDADEDSLVVLDEVGRGTSTRDGYAIAQAATEYLHDEVGAYTLFATHHHELTDVAAELPCARNYHFSAARDDDGTVVFEHDLREGAAEASYGVEVAETAGVPSGVVQRAEALLERDAGADVGTRSDADSDAGTQSDDADSDVGTPGDAGTTSPGPMAAPTASTDGGELPAELRAELRGVDLADTTPLEALNLLARLKSRVD